MHKPLLTSNNILLALQERSHLGVSQGFAGDVALHLGLVDGVYGHPHDAATDYDSPESVSLQRVRVKAKSQQHV